MVKVVPKKLAMVSLVAVALSDVFESDL